MSHQEGSATKRRPNFGTHTHAYRQEKERAHDRERGKGRPAQRYKVTMTQMCDCVVVLCFHKPQITSHYIYRSYSAVETHAMKLLVHSFYAGVNAKECLKLCIHWVCIALAVLCTIHLSAWHSHSVLGNPTMQLYVVCHFITELLLFLNTCILQ